MFDDSDKLHEGSKQSEWMQANSNSRMFLWLQRKIRPRESYLGSMFVQDVSERVFPYQSIDSTIQLAYNPSVTPEQIEVLSRALSTWDKHHDAVSALTEMSRFFAQTIATTGRVDYEIVYLQDSQHVIKGFSLKLVQPGTYFALGSSLFQYVPKDRRSSSLNMFKRFNGKSVVRARLSKKRLRQLSHLHKTARYYQRWQDTLPDRLQRSNETRTPFNFELYSNLSDSAVGAATSPFGWNARFQFDNKLLEPCLLWRRLQFERFFVEIRQLQIELINTALRRVGPQLGWVTQVSLEGALDLAEIERAEHLLLNGVKSFREIYEIIDPPLSCQ